MCIIFKNDGRRGIGFGRRSKKEKNDGRTGVGLDRRGRDDAEPKRQGQGCVHHTLKNDGRLRIGFDRQSRWCEKKKQEECGDGNQQMDHRSGPRVAKSKTTGRRRVEGGSKVRPLWPRVAEK